MKIGCSCIIQARFQLFTHLFFSFFLLVATIKTCGSQQVILNPIQHRSPLIDSFFAGTNVIPLGTKRRFGESEDGSAAGEYEATPPSAPESGTLSDRVQSVGLVEISAQLGSCGCGHWEGGVWWLWSMGFDQATGYVFNIIIH